MRFLESLVDEGYLPAHELEKSAERNGRKTKPILRDLCDREILESRAVLQRMSAYYRMPILDLDEAEKCPSAMQRISFEFAKRYGVFPIKLTGDTLTVAVSDPSDFFMADDLHKVSNCRIERVLCSAKEIDAAIEKYYCVGQCLDSAVKELSSLNTSVLNVPLPLLSIEDLESPVAKTVQRILENAAQMDASDIHFEPGERSAELRYRINGDLTTVQCLPMKHYPSLAARVKIICQMDIAEQRRPQDGRGSLSFRERKIDLRISTIPTLYGEKIVIRLLNHDALYVESLADMGFDAGQREAFFKAIASKQGMILITGPTGSGKTTTLYATLNQIKTTKRNITTIEDPIEYHLSGVNQTQINSKIGVTFSSMLRSILRQDPDIILVGEIRDRDTADIAFRSSLTGHLVFSTLHTNNAIAAVTRLQDIGLEPYLVGSALVCIVAQRLIRRLCLHCREAYEADSSMLGMLKAYLPEDSVFPVFYRAKGCAKCDQTGFQGRMAIFEVLPFNDELRTAISLKVSEDMIERKALRAGFKTMAHSAIEKALEGTTTLEEALPFLPTYEKKEADVLVQLADFIDAHRKTRLLVVKSDELARKIMLHAAPDDYAVIEAGTEMAIDESLPSKLLEFPKALPEPNKTSFANRRLHLRIVRDFVVQFRPSDVVAPDRWETAVVKNLGAGGCYFGVAQPQEPGRRLDMHLQLPVPNQTVPVRGLVKYCHPPRSADGFYYLGISFESQHPESLAEFSRTVNFFLNKKKPRLSKPLS